MTRILVVWEDTYFEPMSRFLKKRLSARIPGAAPPFPVVLFHTARANSNFERYVASTWSNVRAAGLPSSPGPIESLVCVADADRIHDLLDATLAPVDFTSTYHRPMVCLNKLREAQGLPALQKNGPEVDDALGEMARNDAAFVAARVPDVDLLADLVWHLAVSPPAPQPLQPQPHGSNGVLTPSKRRGHKPRT
ncbi:MAG: hypothetical protein HY898_36975 [Deltaproteobacteria bacterium]|nr:hypothetical protein [Deltaproteobacteria bacterium]